MKKPVFFIVFVGIFSLNPFGVRADERGNCWHTPQEQVKIQESLEQFKGIKQDPFIIQVVTIKMGGKTESRDIQKEKQDKRYGILTNSLPTIMEQDVCGGKHIEDFMHILLSERNGESLIKYNLKLDGGVDYHERLASKLMDAHMVMGARRSDSDIPIISYFNTFGHFDRFILKDKGVLLLYKESDYYPGFSQNGLTPFSDLQNDFKADPKQKRYFIMPALSIVDNKLTHNPGSKEYSLTLKIKIIPTAEKAKKHIEESLSKDSNDYMKERFKEWSQGEWKDLEVKGVKIWNTAGGGYITEKIKTTFEANDEGRFVVVQIDREPYLLSLQFQFNAREETGEWSEAGVQIPSSIFAKK